MFVFIRNIFHDVHRPHDLQNTCWPVLWLAYWWRQWKIHLPCLLLGVLPVTSMKVRQYQTIITVFIKNVKLSKSHLFYWHGAIKMLLKKCIFKGNKFCCWELCWFYSVADKLSLNLLSCLNHVSRIQCLIQSTSRTWCEGFKLMMQLLIMRGQKK